MGELADSESFGVTISYEFGPLSNPLDLALAGAEGLEPPTYGFGDRRSTN